MTKLFQLRNSLSNRILTNSQAKNTKGRGKGDIDRLTVETFEPTAPIAPSTISISNVKTRGNQPTPNKFEGAPPFIPGGPSPFISGGPIV